MYLKIPLVILTVFMGGLVLIYPFWGIFIIFLLSPLQNVFDEGYDPIYSKAREFVTQKVKHFSKQLFGTDENLRIKCHATNHGSINVHQHNGAVISGIFYIFIPHGVLRLLDPRLNASRGYPSKFQNYFSNLEIVPNPGDIVLFPSFVWHEVKSEIPQQRVLMPFDVYVDKDIS